MYTAMSSSDVPDMATSPFLGEVSSMHSELVLVPISAAYYNIVRRPKMLWVR